MGNLKVLNTSCSRDEPVLYKKTQTLNILTGLPRADCETWTDGSVGNPKWLNDAKPTSIAVEWDEGWYTGLIDYPSSFAVHATEVQRF